MEALHANVSLWAQDIWTFLIVRLLQSFKCKSFKPLQYEPQSNLGFRAMSLSLHRSLTQISSTNSWHSSVSYHALYGFLSCPARFCELTGTRNSNIPHSMLRYQNDVGEFLKDIQHVFNRVFFLEARSRFLAPVYFEQSTWLLKVWNEKNQQGTNQFTKV